MNGPSEGTRFERQPVGKSVSEGNDSPSTAGIDLASTQAYAGGNAANDATLPPRADSGRSAPEMPTPSPLIFGGYELLNEIARGGMGIVYKARQVSANRIVALKVIQSGQFAGPDDRRRFQVEAEAAASLAHQNIVPIFDVGECDGQNYFSMGLVEGENLRRRVADGPLANREAARIVRLIADAMAYAHSKGIIHRDLKPENVLIDAVGQPHITDFGLAKRLEGDSNLTSTGQVLGTPGYMSPEQAGGETELVGVPSDVYSLGAILYCLLTGRPPFQAPNVLETLLQVMQREPVSPRDINPLVDRDLETICLRCLEKQPSKRFESAATLGEELGRYLRGEPIISRPLGRVTRLWRWSQRNRAVAGLMAAVLVSLLVGIAVSTYFAIVARSRSTQAEKGREIVVRTLQSVIFNVQKKLKSFPEAREVRRTLIQESLKDLETVMNEMESDDAVDHGTAVALADLGRLFDEIGIEGAQNAAVTTERYYLRALKLFEKLREQTPNDLKLLQDYAAALSDITDFFQNLKRPNEAAPLVQRELEMRRQIVAADPANRDSQTMLCKTLIDIANAAFVTGDLQRSRLILEEAIQLRRNEDARGTPSDTEQSQLALALMRLGETCTDLGDLPAARNALESSLEISSKLQKKHSKNAAHAMAVSTVYERLGDYNAKAGDYAAAKASYESMREQTEMALKLDPDNRVHRGDYPVCFDKLYELAERTGDLKAAEQACAKSIELRKALLADDTTNRKYSQELEEDETRLKAVRKRLTATSK